MTYSTQEGYWFKSSLFCTLNNRAIVNYLKKYTFFYPLFPVFRWAIIFDSIRLVSLSLLCYLSRNVVPGFTFNVLFLKSDHISKTMLVVWFLSVKKNYFFWGTNLVSENRFLFIFLSSQLF